MRRASPVLRDARSFGAFAAPPPPSLSLLEIAQEAVDWQAEAESVIACCILPGGKTQVLARRGALVVTVYRVLRDALARLPAASLAPMETELDELLNFHRVLVEQVVLLGFRPDSPARDRIAAQCRGGLAEPGVRLRLLCRDLGGVAEI